MKALVSPDLERYAEAHSDGESNVCRLLREETYRTMELPQMVVGPLEGAFLKMMVRLVQARRVLEIGTFTGYSALSMAEALPEDGRLITCDIDPAAAAVAERYRARSPHGGKVEIKLGPAAETIPTLVGPFDLVFIDADKVNYLTYYQQALSKLARTGVMLVDNVLWSGEVIRNPAPDDTTAAIQEFNRTVASDPRVTTAMVTLRDGVLIVRPR